MQRFKNILLLANNKAEFSETLARAVELAECNQAQLTVVKILKKLPKKEEVAPEDRLERLIAPIRDEGVRIYSKVLTGVPFIEIIRQVRKNKYDLVMKTAVGATGTKAMIFGSTALQLMRNCPCPLWIIKPMKSKRYTRIMAAVDPDTWDPTKAGLNRTIMDLATTMAVRENSELHVVMVGNRYHEELKPDNEVTFRNDDEPGKSMIHERLMNELLACYTAKNLNPQVHLTEGIAADVIVSLAREEHIELIVMGTVGRVGLPRILIGNTAEEVLRQVDCSVLTVKPDGFVTPVTI